MIDKNLIDEVTRLKDEYRQHFGKFPERIIGWWDPLEVHRYPEEMARGVETMKVDVEKAIRTNQPIEEMSEEEWRQIVF